VSCNAQTVCTVPDELAPSAHFSTDALKDCGPTAPGSILELNIGSRSPSILAGDRPITRMTGLRLRCKKKARKTPGPSFSVGSRA
jgi:hypothetical protein